VTDTSRERVLELTGVSKRWPSGTLALDGVDLAVDRGELLAVIGESGSGKSTLLRLVHRMAEPTAGTLRLDGASLDAEPPVALRRRIGYVSQHGGLLPHWSVLRNVTLVPRLLGWDTERRRRRAAELLTLVGLPVEEYGGRFPRQLSGGQRQRVAFARAFAAEPRLVLLDEPFGALDALTRVELRRELRRLHRRLGATALLVTHDLAEAMELGDRVAVMRRGRLEQVSTPDELVARPATDYVERLLELLPGGTGR
jgi:osmoprotectant transport system ATP-binding protein